MLRAGFLPAIVMTILWLFSMTGACAASFAQDENGYYIRMDEGDCWNPVAVPEGVYSFRVFDCAYDSGFDDEDHYYDEFDLEEL